MVGKIEKIKLREVWPHEAYDFTTWMAENMDVINDATGLDLSSPETEKSTGSFNVDIVARNMDGKTVVIENQLENSNHDHLGKLITYLVSMDATAAIWVVADAKPEHIQAVAWLNEAVSAEFFLLKIEAIRIGDSDPAPLLTKLVGPSKESRALGRRKKELDESTKQNQDLMRRYWESLLIISNKRTKLHANISPSVNPWISTSSGVSGLSFNYAVRQNNIQAELYIDFGEDKAEQNLLAFDMLHGHKAEIEDAFGGALEWQRMENRRACRIRKLIEINGYKAPQEEWPVAQEAAVDAMVQMEQALMPHIKQLKV